MKIKVAVIANSKKLQINKIDEFNYKVKVDAEAIKGKANERLIGVFAEYFKVKKSQIKIIKGLTSKNKIMEIEK
jgi:uncharacterized protein (TIGR00251 family)